MRTITYFVRSVPATFRRNLWSRSDETKGAYSGYFTEASIYRADRGVKRRSHLPSQFKVLVRNKGSKVKEFGAIGLERIDTYI